MDATLEIYREEGVHTATLEAIADNAKDPFLYMKKSDIKRLINSNTWN